MVCLYWPVLGSLLLPLATGRELLLTSSLNHQLEVPSSSLSCTRQYICTAPLLPFFRLLRPAAWVVSCLCPVLQHYTLCTVPACTGYVRRGSLLWGIGLQANGMSVFILDVAWVLEKHRTGYLSFIQLQLLRLVWLALRCCFPCGCRASCPFVWLRYLAAIGRVTPGATAAAPAGTQSSAVIISVHCRNLRSQTDSPSSHGTPCPVVSDRYREQQCAVGMCIAPRCFLPIHSTSPVCI